MAASIATQTVTAPELGAVLGLTARRVRQLAEEGVIPRAARGRYELAACVQAYLETIRHAAAGEPADLRAERVELVRAQRRKIEQELAAKGATEQDFAWQEQLIGLLRVEALFKFRLVCSWLWELLQSKLGLDEAQARAIAGEAHNWSVAVCADLEEELAAAARESRQRGVPMTDRDLISKVRSDVARRQRHRRRTERHAPQEIA